MLIRYSQLKDKPKHRLNAMVKKFWSRIIELNCIVKECKKFGIPMGDDALEKINERKKYYHEQLYRVNNVINVRFNDGYKGSLGSWVAEEDKTNEK